MLLTVRVVPNSGKNALAWEQGTLKARLTAPPVDGAANHALIELLASSLAVPKRHIVIVRGTMSRTKVVEITGLTLPEIEQRLQSERYR